MNAVTLQQKKLLRVDEVARILNVSRWTVYRWVEAGRLGGTRIGAGSLRIFSDSVAALIDRNCTRLAAEPVAVQTGDAAPEARRPILRQVTSRGRIQPRSQVRL